MKVVVPGQGLATPFAFIDEAAMLSNIAWMQSLAERFGFELAPHGKTTLSPEIFSLQLQAGAWAITVADPRQAKVAIASGANRVLIANEVIDPGGLSELDNLLKSSDAEIYLCADSIAAVDRVAPLAVTHSDKLHLLIEIGAAGGRCGCRSAEQALNLLRHARETGITIAGLEGYEGSIEAEAADMPAAISAFLEIFRLVWSQLAESERKILSVSGSSYYDIIIDHNLRNNLAPGGDLVLRPGCYVTHDAGFYRELFAAMVKRNPDIVSGTGLKNALFVVGTILSVPEDHIAIANFGRRHIGFDHGNPNIAGVVEDDGRIRTIDGIGVREINDQHCIIVGETDKLQVGDRVLATQSHPCTTFDKWRTIYLVDQTGQINGKVTPQF